MEIPFWIRRKFFDSYGNRPNEQKANLPPNGIRLTCPCCGYPTLGERGAFEICFLCDWEDDGQDDLGADEIRGGPNQDYSLTEARLNFEEYLVMYPPERDTRIAGPDCEDAIRTKREIIEAFNDMLNEPEPEELNRLWKVVGDGERTLEKELKRLIREYSARSQA
ncbi:MAG: CPCC family cysteine-rich protein [Blastocatellia bacterium]